MITLFGIFSLILFQWILHFCNSLQTFKIIPLIIEQLISFFFEKKKIRHFLLNNIKYLMSWSKKVIN